jgi:capsid protein
MWFREALLVWPQWIERMGTAGLEGPRPPHAWFWIRDEHVDPLKEAGAQQIRLRSHTTTLEAEYAAVGRDWEEELDQRRIEIELMRKYALPLDEEKAPGQGQGPEPEEKDEE